MRLLNVLPVVITVLFLMSIHANEAGRILHGGEQELMKKNTLLGPPRGHVLPLVPNPNIFKPVSTISQKAFVSHNVASLQGSLQKGPVPPTAPNPPTHIPASTINQRAFVSNNVDYLQD